MLVPVPADHFEINEIWDSVFHRAGAMEKSSLPVYSVYTPSRGFQLYVIHAWTTPTRGFITWVLPLLKRNTLV